ncbi:MAG TPA: hypothetical protein VHB98_00035 [Chloroflexota bacterium]|jgi:hypothetical protein|nr:hypothetical protein [Chloroflexota bacterium]
MTAIVILAFAAHVVAWLILPEKKVVQAAKESVRTSRVLQASGA